MKEMIKKVKERREGFTMAELLIVVAIIAVLVAIAIPIFTAQLERSKEAVDAANIRSGYAEAMAEAVATNATTATSTSSFTIKQGTKTGWTSSDIDWSFLGSSGAAPDVSSITNYRVQVTIGSGGAVTVSLVTA